VKCLFDEFPYYNLSSERYSPVSVFSDGRRLQDGEDFRESFVSSLLQSKIIVPVITAEALKRMIHHNPSQIDNLLLEWILAIHLSSVSKVFPLVFGSYSLDSGVAVKSSGFTSQAKAVIQNVKGIYDAHSCSVSIPRSDGKEDVVEYDQVNIVNLLTLADKKIVPELTLATADHLLRKNGHTGLNEEMKKQTVDQLISKLLSFQGIFLSSADLSSSHCSLKKFASKHVERFMKALSADSVSCVPSSLRTENDYYFYNHIMKDGLCVTAKETSVSPVACPVLPSVSVALSQDVLDSMISAFTVIRSRHPLTLKFLLYQQFIHDEEYDKAELLINEFEEFDTSSVDDNPESYQQRLQSIFPVGFDENLKLAFSKTPKLLPYRKKVNEMKQQLAEMVSDLQKPFYGIEL
jgi:hypothetical protein